MGKVNNGSILCSFSESNFQSFQKWKFFLPDGLFTMIAVLRGCLTAVSLAINLEACHLVCHKPLLNDWGLAIGSPIGSRRFHHIGVQYV